TRARLYPEYHFTRYAPRNSLPPKFVFVWTEPAPGQRLGIGSLPTLWEVTEQQRYLEANGFRALLMTGRCRSWEVDVMNVHSCLVTNEGRVGQTNVTVNEPSSSTRR